MTFMLVKFKGRYTSVALRYIKLLQLSNTTGGGINSWQMPLFSVENINGRTAAPVCELAKPEQEISPQRHVK